MDFDVDGGLSLITFWGLRVISTILILIAGWMMGKYLSRMIFRVRKLDETLKSFLGGFVQYTVFAIAIITVLGQFGVQTASLIAVLGAAGLAIGLALQGTLSNVAAGVMILVLRPFNVGDFIQFGPNSGTVKSLGLFGTELATAENVYIFSPNATIWNADIYNFSRNPQRRQDILVGISYRDDIDKAFAAIKEVLDSETRLLRVEGKEPQVMVNMMGDLSVDIIVRVWSSTVEYWNIRYDLTKAIKEAFDREGISVSAAQRTLQLVSSQDMDEQKKKKA
ncbi:MAG: mechanosensitive ion channel [Alphaproteobacteria bacterium]|nr:mechanosensitive ion channel [Alphaproteobacteria bacterium]